MSKKKWKRVIKIVLVVLLILIIIALVDFIRKKTSKKDSIDDFINLKELVEYAGGEYYKSGNSTENGYEGDYYIKFPVDPVDESYPKGTNKGKYEYIILAMEEFLQYKDIRIIDESRKLVVRTDGDADKKTVSYTINGVDGYFEKRLAKIQVEQNKEKISNFEITSPELKSIINVNWVRRNASLGTIDEHMSAESRYDHYIDEGYSTKVIGTKIANIIFNKDYKKDVIENIRPGMKITEIVEILGEPTYKQLESVENSEYIGYKLSSCYIFFSDVISVYPIVEFDEEKNNQFAEAVSNFVNGGSKSDFLSKVTEIYPNYSDLNAKEDENKNTTRIEYPLYGFNIILSDNDNRIVIYSNYQGKILNDMTVDEVKLGIKSSYLVDTELHKNAIVSEEANRVEKSK